MNTISKVGEFGLIERLKSICQGDINSEIIIGIGDDTVAIKVANELAGSGLVTSMIDVSDGLASDLWHICKMSDVGAEIHQDCIPSPEIIRKVAEPLEKDQWQYILFGGEDYELIFTAISDSDNKINKIASEYKLKINKIGEILTPESGVKLIKPDGGCEELPLEGWDHFAMGKTKGNSQ